MAMINTRKQQDADLSEIRRMLLRLGKMSENAVSRAVWALEKRDIQTAHSVMDGDDVLDELTNRIDDSCMSFAARYQPLGQDLREVTSMMHMAIDLERIGDYGVNIARAAVELEGKELIKPLIDIPRMAAVLSEMLDKILSIFDVGDAEGTKAVFIMDDQIDELEKQIIRELFTLVMERVDRLEQAFLLMNIARTLERAGDHVTNIAERVVYMYTGKTVKASDYKPPRKPSGKS
ncbi:MAG: phosphate signaling complex protein PhoU [Synergistaceae bacterium]|nr:phosphate signaling complex protein PhoU [Synergistaceae bacterium]